MSVKPILFSIEMVRAILEGRKTVTRRVVKDIPLDAKLSCVCDDCVSFRWRSKAKNVDVVFDKEKDVIFPYHPGDVLWVRETWNRGYIDSSDAELSNEHWFEEYHKRDGSYLDAISGYVYRADFTRAEEYDLGTLNEDNTPRPMPWRPSIHMPREAARIWLRVTDVRVERLQEIDEDGAIAEGLYKGWRMTQSSSLAETARQAFMWLWLHLARKAPDEMKWSANPWVWVIQFERCEKPEEG